MPERADRRRPVILFAVLLAASVPALAQLPSPAPAPVPEFTLQTLDGKTLTRDSLKGKVVLLDFWASWCGPCVRAVPELKSISQSMAGEPFVLVGVNVDDAKEKLEGFRDKHGLDWMQVWDGKMAFTRDFFQINEFPTYVMLDHRGHVIYRRSGWTVASRYMLEATLKHAVADAKKAAAPSPATGR